MQQGGLGWWVLLFAKLGSTIESCDEKWVLPALPGGSCTRIALVQVTSHPQATNLEKEP